MRIFLFFLPHNLYFLMIFCVNYINYTFINISFSYVLTTGLFSVLRNNKNHQAVTLPDGFHLFEFGIQLYEYKGLSSERFYISSFYVTPVPVCIIKKICCLLQRHFREQKEQAVGTIFFNDTVYIPDPVFEFS